MSYRRLFKLFVHLAFVIGVVALVGCGDGRPQRVPVSGTVLIDGKPLTRGNIMFIPSDGRASAGKIDENGRFALTCYNDGDGAILGTHKVTITSAEGISETKTRWYAPKKLADRRTSGLTQKINGPINDLTINISWDGGREFVEQVAGGVEGEDFHAGRKGGR